MNWHHRHSLPSVGEGLAADLRKFRSDESGSITVMFLIVFIAIIAFTGFGVDLMRNEMKRAHLQATLDRAILAAADLEQELDPAAVVQDYFTKSGLADALSSTVVDEGLGYRVVSATASETSDTLFLGLAGIEEMTAPAAGEAAERMGNVEISLVLDRSGSMAWESVSGLPTKIENLQVAASEFIDTVVQGPGAPSLTTVSLVSYNATVSLGPVVSQYFNLSAEHNYSSCAIFPDSAFNTLGISRTETLDRLSHFDIQTTSESTTEIPRPWCPDDSYGATIVHSSDPVELNAAIDALGAAGNTAIDLGMKWGTALLDPSAQDLVSDMITDGHIDPIVAGRPVAYDDPETLKIIVLMTDGENTTEYDLAPHLQTGMSDVWIDDRGDSDPTNDRFSSRIVNLAGNLLDVYYWDRYENGYFSQKYRNTPDGGTAARRMTNAEVYARFGTRALSNKLFRTPYNDGQLPWSGYSDVYYAYQGIVGADHADNRLSAICQGARDAGIIVFTIGFEAPQRGLDAMLDCASSPAHYFDVEGVEISQAFDSIARTITQLRLTQ